MENNLFHKFIVVYRMIFVSLFVAITVFIVGRTGGVKNAALAQENNVESAMETTQKSTEITRQITHFSMQNKARAAHSLHEPVEPKSTLVVMAEYAEQPSAAVTPTEAHTEIVTEKPSYCSDGGSYVYLGTFRCTAYCPCYECSEGFGRGTATGAVATANHTVAVDPSVIPYGSYLMINGVTYRAEDCGGGVNGNSIDIFFDTHWETEQFGLQYLDVYLVR